MGSINTILSRAINITSILSRTGGLVIFGLNYLLFSSDRGGIRISFFSFIQGIGLAARASRYRVLWKCHLEQSKTAISSWCADSCLPVVIIHGAGDLRDLPVDALLGRYQLITLIDSDPGCIPSWILTSLRHKPSKIDWKVNDVTGLLDGWLEQIKLAAAGKADKSSRWDSALKVLAEELNSEGVPTQQKSGEIVSLNILGQLPLFWRDLLGQLLSSYFGKNWVEEHSAQWLNAFIPSAQILIRSYLTSLNTAQRILLITDIAYHLELSDLTTETADPFVDPFFGALGDDLELLPTFFPHHQIDTVNQWSWQVVPAKAEPGIPGAIHLVKSLSICKK